MTTDHGRAFVLQRLSDAPDLASLRRVWYTLGAEYRKCPKVRAAAQALAEGHKEREAET